MGEVVSLLDSVKSMIDSPQSLLERTTESGLDRTESNGNFDGNESLIDFFERDRNP